MSNKQFTQAFDECLHQNLWTHGKQVISGLDWIFRTKSFGLLYELGIYPDIKELSESVAGFRAVKKTNFFNKDRNLNKENTVAMCIGDGIYPRTAALFSLFTKWTSFSVDPLNRGKEVNIQRLIQVKDKAETFLENWFINQFNWYKFSNLVICGVHSHAPLDEIFDILNCYSPLFKNIIVVDIPCCMDFSSKLPRPDMEYVDWSIISPKNTVKIWNIKETL